MPSGAAPAAGRRCSEMMPPAILDTDILSEYLKGYDKTVTALGGRYAKEHGVFRFTSVTVFEMVFGLARKGASSQLNKLIGWLDRNEEVTPLAADYRRAAEIKASAEKQGAIVELPDCLIAAVAARTNCVLVTGNTEHYQAIQRTGLNLRIENWRDAESHREQ
jgi:tRNA(fMet)-specific endonuclease VapC